MRAQTKISLGGSAINKFSGICSCLKALFVALLPILASTVWAENVIEEIIVTAERRSVSIQDTSIAITAITGDTIRDRVITSSIDIAQLTPNFFATTAGESINASFFMRGIGSNDFQPTTESSVSVYIDDVYVRTPYALAFDLMDIERVEVLRGPQGTLYGRNTSGGAINFVSKRAGETFAADVLAGIGNFGQQELQATIAGPLSDSSRVRLSVLRKKRDGYVDNNITRDPGEDANLGAPSEYRNANKWSARALIDWSPSDRVEAQFSVDYTKNDVVGNGHQSVVVPATLAALGTPLIDFSGDGTADTSFIDLGIVFGVLSGQPGPGLDVRSYADLDGDQWAGSYNLPSEEKFKTYGGSARFDFDLNSVALTSITSVRKLDSDLQEDTDSSPNTSFHIFLDGRIDQFTQEFRIASQSSSKFQWVAGAFLFDESFSFDERIHAPFLAAFTGNPFARAQRWVTDQDTRAYALFTQIDYAMTAKLHLTAGLRYSREKKDFELAGFVQDDPHAPTLTQPLFAAVDTSETWSNTSPRLVVTYQPSDQQLIYLSWSKGFKAGGFNAIAGTASFGNTPYDEETVSSWELGYKSTLLNGRANLNLAAFRYDYMDLQVEDSLFLPPAAPATFVTNAGESEVQGVELEFAWLVTDQLMLELGVGWLGAEYTEFSRQLAFAPIGTTASLKGNELVRAPDFSGHVSLQYETTVNWGVVRSVRYGMDYQYMSKHYFTSENTDALSQDGYGLLNAQIALKLGQDIELVLFGKNIADRSYFQSVQDATEFLTGTILQTFAPPKTFGLRVSYHFGGG
ncbi:MAG: TonB-dependent receptor [Gammaproteobacteria bacterium]|nr:TonB-dependent receptor [Gammaproteobacteria bacterium]